MNDNFKTELAAFTQDVEAICRKQICCSDCPFSLGEPPSCCASYTHFNSDIVIPAVEAYRKRKKPCAEVIDRAVDVYTIEVEVERGAVGSTRSVKYFAECAMEELQRYFRLSAQPATVRVLSAKRFVRASHKESDRKEYKE